MAAAVQVDPRFEAFFIVLNTKWIPAPVGGDHPAADRLGSSSPEGRRIFDPDGFLCRMGLIELRRQDHPLPSRIVDASERFVRHLLGDGRFDGRVDDLLSWRSEQLMPGELLPDTVPFPEIPPLGSRHESAIVCMRSHQGSGAVCIAHHRLHMSGHPRVLILDAHDLPHDTSECRDAVYASLREAALACTPMIVDARRITADRVAEVITWVDQGFIPVIVITGPSMSVDLPPDRIVDVPVAAPAVRAAWLDYLNDQIDSPRTVDTLQRLEPEDVRERLLHGNEKMSASAPSDLGALARPVIPTFQLSHVIVPDQVEGELSHLLSRVRLRIKSWTTGRCVRAEPEGEESRHYLPAVRHGKDHGCGSPSRGTRGSVVPRRPVERCRQVHRGDREATRADLHRSGTI